MEKNKKMPLQSLTGSKGKYQVNGKVNHTLTKELQVLNWIYQQTIKGLTATAFESFSQNEDTSFRTRISELGHKYGLEIPRKGVTNPHTGTYYKKYWLSANDIEKVEKILNK
jgi:hypothetical protein